ncbi:DUF2635 domain-containing protein [Acetobacter musti]|uniref:DUF2635 domain-containing protein n=1 Tax=Acetobacter musti TaxID=864732 RepID=A0ABX0JM09_9PROT|nr:DUF2635 domain-containing protein [Acetobacter musti]NHN83665.1 DUF2635 domain-containing protein [Acetobacter musti]
MFVKPADGRAVRWPGSMRLLSSNGENVPDNTFWRRRLKFGDVVKAEAPATAQPVADHPTEHAVEEGSAA